MAARNLRRQSRESRGVETPAQGKEVLRTQYAVALESDLSDFLRTEPGIYPPGSSGKTVIVAEFVAVAPIAGSVAGLKPLLRV